MTSRSIPFEKLAFTDLFCDYIRQDERLKPFYNDFSFDDSTVKKRAKRLRFPGDRVASSEVLGRFNERFDAPSQTLKQVERLREKDSLAVVTGQQLILYGGPLFTVYKTLTTLIYARRWEELLGRPVIPVFWLADEDHDFKEATEVGILVEEKWCSLGFENGQSGAPVGRERFGGELDSFERKLFDALAESDFTASLKELLTGFYRQGATFREAFARLLLHLFGKHGLVLAGSDDSGIKHLISEPLASAAARPAELYNNLEEQSSRLEQLGYERQALVQPSNLFQIGADQARRKLELEDGHWHGENGQFWSTTDLEDWIRRDPSRFSPNVFLRPMMQDRLLPTLAYVCGPGELSYYAQMKSAYEWAGQQMPMLLPRFSITLVEPAIERISSQLPFRFEEYQKRIEDLETLYLKRGCDYDLEQIFGDWLAQTESLTEKKRKEIAAIDPTLEAAAEKAGTLFANELEKLKTKTGRAIKKHEKIQLDRLHRVRENLFPGGRLQERQMAFIYYMNRYGPDIWDRLLDRLAGERTDSHKVITL